MSVTDSNGAPITEGTWVYDEDYEHVLCVDEIREDSEEGSEVEGTYRGDPYSADPLDCVIVTAHGEGPDWFRDEHGKRWISPVGDGSINAILYDDELASFPPLVRSFTVETYQKAWPPLTGDAIEYRWRARARNGEIIASGEGYADKRDRDHVIELMWPGIDTVEVEG